MEPAWHDLGQGQGQARVPRAGARDTARSGNRSEARLIALPIRALSSVAPARNIKLRKAGWSDVATAWRRRRKHVAQQWLSRIPRLSDWALPAHAIYHAPALERRQTLLTRYSCDGGEDQLTYEAELS